MAKDDIRKFDFSQLIKGRTETEIISHEKDTVLTIPGIAFLTENPDTDQVYIEGDECGLVMQADGIFVYVAIQLPNHSTILSVKVFGTAVGETFNLVRNPMDATSSNIMATASIGAKTESITSPIVDNETYAYYLYTSSLDTGDLINGVQIKYRRGT